MVDHRSRYKQKRSNKDKSKEEREEEITNDKWKRNEEKYGRRQMKEQKEATNVDRKERRSCAIKRKFNDDHLLTKYQNLQDAAFGHIYR